MKKRLPIFYLFVIFTVALFCQISKADKKPKAFCNPPKEGPAWLQDFTPFQKSKVDVEWEIEGKSATYNIDGTYSEQKPKDIRRYSEFSNETSLELTEDWRCVEEASEFVALRGKMETELEWETKTKDQTQEFESENLFQISNLNDVRHVGHESEKTTEVHTPWTKKETQENLEWKQFWDSSNIPVVTGIIELESSEESMIPSKKTPKKRMLANTILIPGYQPKPLRPGRRLVIETQKAGKLNGPMDPVLMETIQTAKQFKGDKLIEEKDIKIKETSYYLYNPNNKNYEFLSLNELYHEKGKNTEDKKLTTIHRLETWNDLNSAAAKSSHWKEILETKKIGASSTFTIKSGGHEILPTLFDVKTKNGSFTRITDYNARGKITRFLVLYFPPNNKGNETKMDIKFDDNGKMKEFIVDDGINELETYEDAFNNAAALYTLQSKIKAVMTMEKMGNQKKLPARTIRTADYPVVYTPPQPEEKK